MFKLIYLYLFIINIYKEKIDSKESVILSSLLFLVIDYIFSLTTINSIFITYISSIIFYKVLLNKKYINYYLLSLISLPGLIISPNKFINIVYILILFLTKKYIIKLINYLNRNKKILFVLILIIYLIILINLLPTNISLNNLSNIIIMFLINTLIIINIEQNIKIEHLTKKYQELKLYAKNNDSLVTNYRSMVHENKIN